MKLGLELGNRLEPVSLGQMIGATGWTGSDFFQTANPGGEAGDAAGFGVVLLFRVNTQSVASATRILTERTSGLAGWLMFTGTTNASLTFFSYDATPAAVGSPAYTIAAGDVGKLMMAVGVHDTTHVRLYMHRVEVGSGTAQGTPGYTAASARQTVGARSNGTVPADGVTIFGISTYRGVKTLAQIQALYDDVKIARDILGSGHSPTNGWSLKRAGGAAPPASVSNLGSGTDAMSRAGSSLTYNVVSQPVFGW